MRPGSRLLTLARERDAQIISVVGTGKGVGKTTALLAIYEAAFAAGLRTGVASVGFRARLPLRAGTLFATARALHPRSPAAEIARISRLNTAVGPLLYARAASDGAYDVVGPSTASALRATVKYLGERCDLVLLDGAIDRQAMLSVCDGAIVVSCGAAGAKTQAEAVASVAALTARLRVPRIEDDGDSIALDGALTATLAAEFIARGERRPIVVGDATQIVLEAAALAQALQRLRIRCRHPLHVVAATVCALGGERSFEPHAFLHEVARATGLPAFDVFAAAEAA